MNQHIQNYERNARVISLCKAGMTDKEIGAQLGLSREAVKGVLARWRRNNSSDMLVRFVRTKFRNKHPLVRRLAEIQRQERMTWHDIAKRAGVSSSCMRHWRLENGPRLTNFEAVLNVLGYELVIRPKADRLEAAE